MTVKFNILACTIVFCSSMLVYSSLQAQSGKIQAQQLVDSMVKKNADVAALEVSATPPGKTTCVTIAATEARELGEKCDEDEFAALKTGMPHIEKEADGYDVTAPLHDANGNLVGIVGIDFKLESGQTDASILQRTSDLLKELGRQISSKGFLFIRCPEEIFLGGKSMFHKQSDTRLSQLGARMFQINSARFSGKSGRRYDF